MRLSRARLIGATVVLCLIPASIATALPCPSLRVEAPAGTIIPAEDVCSTRAYLDDAGVAHALAPKTALGQLVAGAGSLGFPLGITFNAQFGGFVGSIGGVAPGPTGTWSLLVNNRLSQTGASTTILKPSQEVVWLLDPDFNRPGPFVLDMDVVRSSGGVLVVKVVRTDGIKVTPAKGARVNVNGTTVIANANGRARIKLTPNAEYSAVATLPRTLQSQVQNGQV